MEILLWLLNSLTIMIESCKLLGIMDQKIYTEDFKNRASVGLYGEYYALAELARRGIPSMKLANSMADCDIITRSNTLIEVKTAKPQSKDWQMKGYEFRCWQFTNHSQTFDRKSNLFVSGRRRRKCDFYIFIGLKNQEILVEKCWIIPEVLIKDKRSLLFIDSEDQLHQRKLNNMGSRGPQLGLKWYDEYIDRWDLIYE